MRGDPKNAKLRYMESLVKISEHLFNLPMVKDMSTCTRVNYNESFFFSTP